MAASVLPSTATDKLFSKRTNGVSTVQSNKIPPHTTQRLEQPPGHPRVPYVLQSLCGEIIYIPCSKSATRLLVTGKETDNAFAVVGSGGAESPPIGFHYHNEAHDVFLCLKGQLTVWADDQARTMNPGDFASVPPKVVHQYQILGTYTEFLGLIVPGGWEEFFRFIGEPYTAGPLFPLHDSRNPFEVLIPKLKLAAEQFDMVPQPQHPSFAAQPWRDGADDSLPGAARPYFLRNNTGPAFRVGATLVRPLATSAESGGRFSIASIEGSNMHTSSALFVSNPGGIVFASTHHCFQVADGAIELTLNSAEPIILIQGETAYIPAGTAMRFTFASRFAKIYVFSNGPGLNELLPRLGQPFADPVLPEEPADWDITALETLQTEFGYTLLK